MTQLVPESRTVTVCLTAQVPGEAGAWVSARQAGHRIVDEPVGGARVSSCADLRTALEQAGAGVAQLIHPTAHRMYRVVARMEVPLPGAEPLCGWVYWRSVAGKLWVPDGPPWTACPVLGPTGHQCAE